MVFGRRALVGLALVAAGCRAGAPAQTAASAETGAFSITERAEPAPVTALAFRAPILVAGGAHGVRRWDVTSDEYEVLGPDEGLPGHGVTAVGLDEAGAVWVATDAGIGRFSRAQPKTGEGGGPWRYEGKGGLAGVTALVPTAQGAWAGGADGLFRGDGTSWAPVEGLRGVVVSSLDLDADGQSVWVGTRARGLFHVDPTSGAQAVEVPVGDDPAALEEIVGTAMTAVGTRVAAARSPNGSRLLFLEQGNPQAFRAQPDVRVVRLVDTGKEAVLVAGPAGGERAYALQLLHPGEEPPPGGLRFVSVKKGTATSRGKDRWVAAPLDVEVPPDVVTAAGGGGAVYASTARLGVARAAKGHPAYLPGATLVGDAERLTVACATSTRCFAVTDGPRAWLTDGDVYREVAVGEADDATVLAVVADKANTIYALSSEPKYTGLVITRLARAAAAGAADADKAGGDLWKGFHRVPLVMPSPGGPAISFAAISPAGVLWVGLKAHTESGDDVSAGALELDLASHHAIQHRATKAGEARTPEMLPLPAALTGVFFEPDALWFSSLSGVSRWSQGDLRSWGENEGIRSELVHGVGRGPGDALWAATSEGLSRYDGTAWRGFGLDEESVVACRGVARDARGLWVATAKGLRLVTEADAKVGRDGETVLPRDMRDVKLDRDGRLWALSASSISVVRRRGN